METNELSIGGSVCVWKSSSANRNSLLKKLTDIGVADFCPESTTRHLALRNALRSVYGVDKVKVLTGFANFAVINAVATREDWTGQSTMTYRAELDKLVCTGLEYGDPRIDEVQRAFETNMENITSNDVSKMLVRLAYHFGGVPCASGAGGAYWIPKDSMAVWKDVARAVENSSTNGRAKVFMFTTAMDDEAIRAVVGSLENNICKELEDMEAEVASGKLKKRALQSRERILGEKRQKIREYESMLGVTMKKLHDAVEKTKKTSVIAALMSFGSE
mgnify:CR=1 FL=1|jgi:hypothetical protein|tara:strand:- start:16302 stop:17126 length:825 start_codon:yes stop_codon:yes gene_type:complete